MPQTHLRALLLLLLATSVASLSSAPDADSHSDIQQHSNHRQLGWFEQADALESTQQDAWWNVGGLVVGWSGLTGSLATGWLSGLIDVYKNWIDKIGNVLFVVLVAIGFAVLPRRLMLILGFFGLLFGRFVVTYALQLLGLLTAIAVYVPGVAVFLMWLTSFTSSKAAQWIGLRLGLDTNKDGMVDWHDIAYTVVQRYAPEDADEMTMNRKKHPTIKDVYARLERIEALLAHGAAAGGAPPFQEDPSVMV